MKEVIIVGAGLSGLSAAYYLKQKGIDVLVLEARERWGGRILTVPAAGKATPVEMGATWFGNNHLYLKNLLQELNLPFHRQYQEGLGLFETDLAEEPQLFRIPAGEEPSYRVAGGTATLIAALVQHIGRDKITLGTPVTEITEQEEHIQIKSRNGETFFCRHLVIALPPYLLGAQKIRFNPALPGELVSVINNTHTWMGDAIKFAVEYESPFWRQQGYSGTAFSHAGIAPEMYDHSNAEKTHFALKGFLAAAAANLAPAAREAKVMGQLTRLFGKEAANYLSYTEKVWRQDIYTYADYPNFVMPHQHNGHPLYSRPLMNGKLFWAGSETSPLFGGYMEGAVYSGQAVANIINR